MTHRYAVRELPGRDRQTAKLMRELLPLLRRIGRIGFECEQRRLFEIRHGVAETFHGLPAERSRQAREIPADRLGLERQRARMPDVADEQIERRPEPRRGDVARAIDDETVAGFEQPLDT